MKPIYRQENSGHPDSLEVGNEFQDFVCIQLAKQGIILQNINSKKFQYNVGENLQGFEIKFDSWCTGYGKKTASNRLSIEVAEKTKVENRHFIDSGIFRNDNAWLYIHGTYDCFWIFSVKILRELYKSGRYQVKEEPTIKTFYLPVKHADRYCSRKFDFRKQEKQLEPL